MRTLRHTAFLLVLALWTDTVHAQTTWHVDDDCVAPGAGTESEPFCKIQDGIDAASDGDTVLVAPGTYSGGGNRDISLFGKSITVIATEGPDVTTIDIQGGPDSIHRGFFLIHGETSETIIDGFTIMNGYLIGDTGGSGPAGGGGGAGIYIRNSSPTVRNCVLKDNVSETLDIVFLEDGMGGAIYVDGNSSAGIISCLVSDNSAARLGGGVMYIGDGNSTLTIQNCLISGNSASKGGGLRTSGGGSSSIIDTAVVDNAAVFSGGGIYNSQSQAFLSNCVLWGNETNSNGPQIFVQGPELTIEHSDVQGGLAQVEGCCNWQLNWGPGMIETDPLFVDPVGGDFHLLHGSPVIDAGNNLVVPEGVVTDLDGGPRFLDDPDTRDTGNPDPDAPRLPIVDMGPYEFDHEDCNNNDTPDAEDLANGTSQDCNRNTIPDECEIDCNDNDQPDDCDVTDGFSEDCNDNLMPDECEVDCNENGQPDDCDITEGVSEDCTANGIPDECEVDCNDNGQADTCDIAERTSEDCTTNGIPDECEPDCNANGQGDSCDIADGISNDCNGNGVPDECPQELPGPPITQQPVSQQVEVGGFAFFQVQADGVLLEYQWRKDGVDLIDSERILGTQTSTLVILDTQPSDAGDYDCVVTDLVDSGCSTSDPATLSVTDPCPADVNDDGVVGPVDLAMLLAAWGPCPDPDACPADLNADATVDPFDLAQLLAAWGPCS